MSKQSKVRKDHITVIVRCRPENARELGNKDSRNIVQVYNENTIIFDPSDPSVSKFGAMSLGKRNKHCIYEFDHVFGPQSTQVDVYNIAAAPLLAHTLEGYNASVFAYGATGAGKTHTMIGNPECGPGVMILALQDLYAEIEQIQKEKLVKISISYLEVYNELIRDLLSDSSHGNEDSHLDDSDFERKNLELCEDSGQVTVRGLSWHQPNRLEELMNLLERGNTYRTRSATDANALSSRSHAVLQIHVETKSKLQENMNEPWTLGKLSLIDLAGSERASVSRNCGERQKEGANINRSLLALGNCINALCQNKKKTHVPYRDSKLTRLLKDSLGGSCKTVMIANVSPSSLSYDDTHNTLKYANRTKNIKTTLSKNVSLPSAPQDQQEIINLRLQLANTQKQLKEALQSQSNCTRNPNLSEEEYLEAQEIFQSFQNKIEELFGHVTKYKTQQQLLNKTERKLVAQLHKSQQITNSITPTSISSIENEINNIHEQHKVLHRNIEQLNSQIRRVYQDIDETAKIDETYRSFLHHDIQFHRTVIEKQDLVDLCASKDCKLQLQQLRIQELERNAALNRHTTGSRAKDSSDINSHSNLKRVPSHVINETFASQNQRANARSLKIARVRNSMRPLARDEISERRVKKPTAKRSAVPHKETKPPTSSTHRFTFSSPPHSFQRLASQTRSHSSQTKRSRESTIPTVPTNETPAATVPTTPAAPVAPTVPATIEESKDSSANTLKLTSLVNIGSPPRRVVNRKRKQKLVNKQQGSLRVQQAKTGNASVAAVHSQVLPAETPGRASDTPPMSIAQQLSALKEKRAEEIAKRKARMIENSNSAVVLSGLSSHNNLTSNHGAEVPATPVRALQNSTIANRAITPLPTLKPGTLRRPSISLFPSSQRSPSTIPSIKENC